MHRYLPLALIIGLLIAFRVVGSYLPENQPNFQPLVALFFCGALLAPGWRGLALPIGIWALTYPLGIGPVSDLNIFVTTFGALLTIYLVGQCFAQSKLPVLLGGAVASAVLFHAITNIAAWIGDPMYAKNLTGLWQSLWLGPPASPLPSWLFLRNLVAANVLFTAIFVLAQLRLPKTTIQVSHPLPAK